MTNENKNVNELVSNDEYTAEVELVTNPRLHAEIDTELEADADTCNFEYADRKTNNTIAELRSELRERSETIGRLRYDIEQVRARRQGLEAELEAREEATTRLNREISELRRSLEHSEKLLGEREDAIKSLEAGTRQLGDELQAATAENGQLRAEMVAEKERFEELLRADDTGQFRSQLAEQAGRLASYEALMRDLTEKFARAERYGDSLRRRLQEATETADAAIRLRDELQHSHGRQHAELGRLQAEVERLQKENSALAVELAGIHEAHAEELRQLRFELGEAQETATQHELVNEQLAADLVQTHGFTVELENKLDRTDKETRTRIQELEQQNRLLRNELLEQEEQLAMKSEAIHALLAEIGKKSQQVSRAEESDRAQPDSNDRRSEDFGEPPAPAADKDRVTRVLTGSVDGREVQFPLFKDRLSIGRTEQNDIQLKAPYISRRHALIITEGDTTRVVDWGSKNGVFVNSRRIGEHFLANGDIIAIGIAKFRYEELPKR